MLKRSAVLLLLGLFLAGVQAPPLQAQAQTSGQKTEVLLYTPYTAQGLNKDLHSTRTSIGTCTQASQVDVNRPDAWACNVQNRSLDPCFANFDGSELACPDLPPISSPGLTSTSMMNVVLVHPIPDLDMDQANTPGPDPTPFLIQLVDGQFCVPEPADVRYAGLPIFGYCTGGYWFGPGDLSKDLWLMPVLQTTSTPSIASLVNIGIARVWY
jgi:hypothetical protein